MHIETESMNNICHSKLACIFQRAFCFRNDKIMFVIFVMCFYALPLNDHVNHE